MVSVAKAGKSISPSSTSSSPTSSTSPPLTSPPLTSPSLTSPPLTSPPLTSPSRGRPRDPERAELRREQILAAATSHFASHGYQDSDLQVIANDLGIGKGTIYRYFASKEVLFKSALDRGLQELTLAIDRALPPGSDPLGSFITAIQTYLSFFREKPDLVELFVIERAVFPGQGSPAYFRHREADKARWRISFLDLIEKKRVRRLDPDAILDVIGDLLYGTMFANHLSRPLVCVEDQAKHILEVVFHGLLSPQSRAEYPGQSMAPHQDKPPQFGLANDRLAPHSKSPPLEKTPEKTQEKTPPQGRRP